MIPARKSFFGELLVFGICRRSIWRSFHSVRLKVAEPLPAPPAELNIPVIFYCNHSTWWDGYVAHILSRQVFNLDPYLMMDEKQLKRFKFFSWAGCFSVNRENPREALKSLQYIAAELVKRPGRALWIFPQGEIEPSEKRPLDFQNGLGWLVRRLDDCLVYPVSLRFEFMREQFPDIFVYIGAPVRFSPEEKKDIKNTEKNGLHPSSSCQRHMCPSWSERN
ncbi:MAG: glycerol acyltransferase [Candidatus Omnitrophica bacterium]|nr:glycerol acyltransferase [Candidatus Omnitrophota bacterium]